MENVSEKCVCGNQSGTNVNTFENLMIHTFKLTKNIPGHAHARAHSHTDIVIHNNTSLIPGSRLSDCLALIL